MIRPGLPSDTSRVIELLRDSRVGAGFDTSAGVSGFAFPFDPAYAERLFVRYLRAPLHVCWIHTVRDVPQGILLAHAFEHDFGPVWMAQERVWWIDPAHRGGTAAVRMLDTLEDWARDVGCDFVGMAGMGGDPAVAILYERRGYRRAETHFLKAAA